MRLMGLPGARDTDSSTGEDILQIAFCEMVTVTSVSLESFNRGSWDDSYEVTAKKAILGFSSFRT